MVCVPRTALRGPGSKRYITDVIVGAKLHGLLKRQPMSEEEAEAAGAAKKKKDAMPTLELKWEVQL